MGRRDHPQAEPLAHVDEHALDDEQAEHGEDHPLLRDAADERGDDEQERERPDDVSHVAVQLDIAGADEDEHAGEEDLEAECDEIGPGEDRERAGPSDGANHCGRLSVDWERVVCETHPGGSTRPYHPTSARSRIGPYVVGSLGPASVHTVQWPPSMARSTASAYCSS